MRSRSRPQGPQLGYECEPRVRRIDKTGFILRRDCFVPFPEKRDDGGPTHADGLLIEWLVSSQSVTHAKVPDALVVHN